MAKQRLYLGTNTKMYMDIAQTTAYLRELCRLTGDLDRSALELFVIPSFTALECAHRCIPAGLVRLGAQNMGWDEEGPYTGEISPRMLREVGVSLVELGHSERRHVLCETDEMINRKVLCAERGGFTVLLCIGETAQEKHKGIADEVLRTQLKAGLFGMPAAGVGRLWVGYEPVWAIGAGGVPATAEYAGERHRTIRGTLCQLYGAEAGRAVPLLYGGSVNLENAPSLRHTEDIDGLFIGRSAWRADQFNTIIRAVL